MDEGQANVVGAVLTGELQIGAILLGQRGNREHDVGDVDALVVGQGAADHDLGLQGVGVLAGHAQAQLAVVQQQCRADRRGFDDFGMRQIDPLGVAGGGVQVQAQALAGLQVYSSASETADSEFRTLNVAQDADGAVEFRLQLADHGEAGGVAGMVAVRKIQPEYIGAGLKQTGQNLNRAAGGAEGGDDLGSAAAAQLRLDCHFGRSFSRSGRL